MQRNECGAEWKRGRLAIVGHLGLSARGVTAPQMSLVMLALDRAGTVPDLWYTPSGVLRVPVMALVMGAMVCHSE